jgi:hypothetical protein
LHTFHAFTGAYHKRLQNLKKQIKLNKMKRRQRCARPLFIAKEMGYVQSVGHYLDDLLGDEEF